MGMDRAVTWELLVWRGRKPGKLWIPIVRVLLMVEHIFSSSSTWGALPPSRITGPGGDAFGWPPSSHPPDLPSPSPPIPLKDVAPPSFTVGGPGVIGQPTSTNPTVTSSGGNVSHCCWDATRWYVWSLRIFDVKRRLLFSLFSLERQALLRWSTTTTNGPLLRIQRRRRLIFASSHRCPTRLQLLERINWSWHKHKRKQHRCENHTARVGLVLYSLLSVASASSAE